MRQILKNFIIESHRDGYEKIYRDDVEASKLAQKKREQLLDQRMKLRTRMRHGKLINTDYQRMVGPINRELERLNSQLSFFHQSEVVNIPLSENLKRMNMEIHLYDSEEYFTEHNKKNE